MNDILAALDGAEEFDDLAASEFFEPHDAPHPADAGDFGFASQAGGEPGHDDGGGGGRAHDQNSHVWRWEHWLSSKRWRFDLDWRCAQMLETDLGNMYRFLARHGERFLYVEQWGWLAWDGRRWSSKDAKALFNRAVHMTIEAISREARLLAELQGEFAFAGIKDRDDRVLWLPDDVLQRAQEAEDEGERYFDPIVKQTKTDVTFKSDRRMGWAIGSQSNSRLTCLMNLAEAYLTRDSAVFDADPMLFNCSNGTLRFSKEIEGYVGFGKHRRADLMTRISEVVYDAAATCPDYDRFLEVVQPSAEMRLHLHVWAGVSLTAIQIAKLQFWYGKGRNGKSTASDAWAQVFGEYSQTIPIESFLDQGRSRRGGEASPDIAALPGVRFLRTSEPEKGAQLAESLVKLVTGGEPLRARHLNRDFFEFKPAFKLTMQGNYRPNVTGTDEGFWRRMLLVPWNVTIPEAEVDADLPAKLKTESSGILNRMLDGLRVFLDKGLVSPSEIVDATAGYRDDSDPVGRFLKECTVDVPPTIDEHGRRHDSRVAGKEIYETYVAWAKADGEKPWTPKGFSKGLQDHGVKRIKSSGIFYLGLTMVKGAHDFEGMEIDVEHGGKAKKTE